jgi:hypothetical protein
MKVMTEETKGVETHERLKFQYVGKANAMGIIRAESAFPLEKETEIGVRAQLLKLTRGMSPHAGKSFLVTVEEIGEPTKWDLYHKWQIGEGLLNPHTQVAHRLVETHVYDGTEYMCFEPQIALSRDLDSSNMLDWLIEECGWKYLPAEA